MTNNTYSTVASRELLETTKKRWITNAELGELRQALTNALDEIDKLHELHDHSQPVYSFDNNGIPIDIIGYETLPCPCENNTPSHEEYEPTIF